MYKRILGVAVLIVLASILVFNMVQKDSGKEQVDNISNEYDVSGDTNVKGAAIMPPGSEGIDPGEMAPDFELETVAGESLKLSDLRGKKVMLNFWATWCPPCKKEMPEIQKLYEEHGDEIEIVAVNLTDSESKVKDVYAYVEKYNYTYPVPLDKKSEVSDIYMAITIPTTYFIGTDGKIQQPRKLGPMSYEFMEEMMNSLH